MAQPSGNVSDCDQPILSTRGGSSTPAPSTNTSIAFTKLSSLIPDTNKFHFSTAVDLAEEAEEKSEQCADSPIGCYMLVTGVSEDMVDPIDEEFYNHSIRKGARFTYEHPLQSLIIKMMPGTTREQARFSFYSQIEDKITNIPRHSWRSIVPVGKATFITPGVRSKEGDARLKPSDTRQGEAG